MDRQKGRGGAHKLEENSLFAEDKIRIERSRDLLNTHRIYLGKILKILVCHASTVPHRSEASFLHVSALFHTLALCGQPKTFHLLTCLVTEWFTSNITRFFFHTYTIWSETLNHPFSIFTAPLLCSVEDGDGGGGCDCGALLGHHCQLGKQELEGSCLVQSRF